MRKNAVRMEWVKVQSWALAVFFNIFKNVKLYFFQVSLVEG